MRAHTPTRWALVGQGTFWVAGGLWPILDLKSFAKVTGPKPEGWLVKSVGTMMVVIGSTLLNAARQKKVSPEAKWLALTSATALASLDLFYVAKGRIKPTYLFDDLAQVSILGMWGAAGLLERRTRKREALAQHRSRESFVSEGKVGQWDIAPGETLTKGRRDVVEEASMESFPASDSPSYSP